MRLTIFFTLAIFWGLTGCHNPPDSVSSSQGSSTSGGSEVSSVNKEPVKPSDPEKTAETKPETTEKRGPGSEITSIYTDLAASKCKDLEKNEEEGWSLQECAGVGGYKLEVAEGDIRQTINVISPSKKKSELNLWSVVSPAFSSVGAKAEWRVKTVDGKAVPFALIVRYNASETPDKPEKLSSYLTVTKIDGDTSCVVDVVKPIKNANVKARELADASAGKPCLKGR